MSFDEVLQKFKERSDIPTPQEFVRSQTEKAVDRSVVDALKTTPDAAAKHYGIAKREGLSVEEAQRQADQLRVTGALQGFSSESLTKRYPETAKVFADPALAAVGWDDLETIKAMEQAQLDLKSAPERYLLSLKSAASTSLEQNQMSLYGADEAFRTLAGKEFIPENTAELKRLEALQQRKLDYGLEGIGGTITEGANIAIEGMLGSMVDIIGGKATGATAGGAAGAILNVRRGPAAMLKGARVGAALGSEAGGYLGATVPMVGSLWQELKTTAPDLDPKVRAWLAISGGAVEGYLEKLGFESVAGGLQKAVKNPGFKKAIGVAFASLGEATTEGAQALVEVQIALAATGAFTPPELTPEERQMVSLAKDATMGAAPDPIDPKRFAEKLNQFTHVSRDGERFHGLEAVLVRVAESMAQGAIGGGYASSVGAGAKATYDVAAPMVKAQAAKTTQAAIEQVVKLAGKSKLAQRNPEAFRDATARMMPDTKIHIAAEGVRRFFQDGENEFDDSAEYNRARGFREQAQEASLTGADMTISYADWIAYVAPTDFGRATMKDVRVSDPRAMTANEADVWEKENFGGFKGVQDMAAAAKSKSDVEQVVRDELRLQIGRKGGNPDQVEKEVDLQLVRAERRASRLGKSLRALIKDEGLFTTTVEGESVNLGPSLEEKLRRIELTQAVKDLRSERGPESRMKKAPVTSLLAVQGINPESRLGRTLWGTIPEKGPGSIPGFWRKGGMTEADQFAAYEHDIFTDNALLDASGYLTNDQIAEIVNNERNGKVLRTQAEQYAIHEANAAKLETERAIKESGIADPNKLSDEELANALLEAERVTSSDTGPAIESITHESAGLKPKAPPRGAIDITPDLRGVVVRFFKAHDGSTMLHEGGHLWIEQLRKDATGPRATEQLRRDWAIVKDWLGIRRGDRISERNSERFARAVEQYLLEGEAPSTRLESVFQSYAVWLLRIYKTLRNKYFKDVRLTDPVRGVLDRMLATDAEIFAAQQNRGLRNEVLSTADGLTPDEVADLREAVEAGSHEAEMENVRIQVKRQRRRALKLWKDNLEKVRAEVTSAVDSRPDVQVSQWVRYGKAREGMEFPPAARQVITPQKFSKAGLIAVAGSNAILKVLSSGKYGYYSKEGGYDPAFVADIFGYASPAQMLSDLSDLQNAGGRDAIIERMTQATMEKRYGKFDQSAEYNDLVIEAAANEKAVRALELADRLLAARTGKKRLAREVADRIAKNIISKMPVRDIMPRKGSPRASERYRAAAEREAQLAVKAHANGDLRNMQLHKQRQMVNLAIEREARTVEQRVRSSVLRISKFAKPHAQAILGKAGDGTTVFQDQMAKLLARFGFPTPDSNSKPQSTLADFVSTWTGKGANFRIAPSIYNEDFRADYTNLTVDTFYDVAQAIESVYGSARTLVEATLGADAAALETDIEEIVAELKGAPPAAQYVTPKTTGEKVKGRVKGYFAAQKQMEHLIDRIGPVARALLWRPLADAEARAFDLTEQTTEPVTQAYKALVKSDPAAYSTPRSFLSLRSVTNPDGRYSKSDLLMMAANMMNASNAEKMTKGMGWTEPQVWTVLEAELTKEDWDFVELAIERLETLWAPAVAQELRLTGTAPQPIQPRPHTLPNGRVLKGGYFPVIYDVAAIKGMGHQLTSKTRSETDIFSVLSGLQRVVTGHTHLLERDDMANAPISFDINGLPNHLQAVIHDLTHREPLLRIYKIIKNEAVYNGLVNRVGVKEADLFAPWIADIAQYAAEGNIATQEIYKTLRNFRARLLIMTLGGRITTLMLQPLGSAIGYVLGTRQFGADWKSYHASEMRRMISEPRAAADFARSKSAMMRRRTHTYDRDYAELLESSFGVKGKIAQVGEQAMGALAGVQFFTVDVPLWNAAYAAAKSEKGLSDADAIDMADAIVEKSQGSGSVKNRSAFLRDRGLLSMLTMYFTYHNTLFNVLDEGRHAGVKGRQLASEYLLMFVIPAIASYWERQLVQDMEQLIGVDDPDEQENALVQTFLAIAAEPMNMLAGVRDLSSAVSSDRMFDPSTPPEIVAEWAGALITETKRTVEALDKGNSPRNALVRMAGAAARLTALYFKAPAGYMIGLVEKGAKEKK